MADGKANPYGNGFTPFRILSALYSSETDEAKALWGNESNFSTNGPTREDVEKALNISKDKSMRLLKKMIAIGFIEVTGKGQKTEYILK